MDTDITIIGVPLSISGVGKNTLFQDLGDEYIILQDGSGSGMYKGLTNDNIDQLLKLVENGHNRIILNKDFRPSNLKQLKSVVERLKDKKNISVIGLWFGQNAPEQRFTVGELKQSLKDGTLENPFTDRQLWFSLHNGGNREAHKSGIDKSNIHAPHMIGYFYKEWNPDMIAQNIDDFGIFDQIIRIPSPSAEPDPVTLHQIKNEFYTPQNQTGGSKEVTRRIQNLPLVGIDYPSVEIGAELIHQEFGIAQWGGANALNPLPRYAQKKDKKKNSKRRSKKQAQRKTIRGKIARNNANKVKHIHRHVNRSSKADMAILEKHQDLLNKPPYELTKEELEIINNHPLLFELYRNIYVAMMN